MQLQWLQSCFKPRSSPNFTSPIDGSSKYPRWHQIYNTASPTATSPAEPQGNIPFPYLLAPVGEARVASNLPLEVELTFAVPTQVNGAGLDMDVHQVVNDPALDVILDPVDQEPPTNVDDFDERKLPRESTTRMRGMPTGKAEKHTTPTEQPGEVSQSI